VSEIDPHPPKEDAERAERQSVPARMTCSTLPSGCSRKCWTDCEARSSALDLLTVDALMTRALEIAARNPSLLEEFPEQAMRRIASRANA
jgi:hypothetical protein